MKPKGPKPEARKTESGPSGSWRGGLPPLPPARGFAGALRASPVGSGTADKNFGAFWVFQVSCPAVLLCKSVCV